MVTSIRHWCDVLRLVQPTARGEVSPTELGKLLIVGDTPLRPDDEPGGQDPYLEDVGTLWLLHYLLASREDGASTWHLAFTQLGLERFDREALVGWLAKKAEQAESRVSRSTIERDVQVFLRTYLPARSRKDAYAEESFDCPLVELGLLHEAEEGFVAFTRTRRRTLPPHIFAFALLDYWASAAAAQESVSFDRLLYGPGSPGAVFKLSENELSERLERLSTGLNLEYRETAGTRVLYGSPDLSEHTRLNLLKTHYAQLYGGPA